MYSTVEFCQKLNKGVITAEALLADTSQMRFSWHPLGFIMCKLLEREGTSIRLHIWPPDGGRAQEPRWMIHDHIFDLSSWVLKGTVFNREYEADANGNEFSLYEASYVENKSVLTRRQERIGLTPISAYEIHSGGCYTISAGILHESELVGNEVGVTVLLTEESKERTPLVVGSLDGKDKYEYSRELVSKEELRSLLEAIQARH